MSTGSTADEQLRFKAAIEHLDDCFGKIIARLMENPQAAVHLKDRTLLALAAYLETGDGSAIAEPVHLIDLDDAGPYELAAVIVDRFSIHQLVRFGLEFRRRLEARVTAEDHFMDSVSKTFD